MLSMPAIKYKSFVFFKSYLRFELLSEDLEFEGNVNIGALNYFIWLLLQCYLLYALCFILYRY